MNNKNKEFLDLPQNDPHYRENDIYAIKRSNLVFHSGEPLTLENFKEIINEKQISAENNPFHRSILSGYKWDFKTKTSHPPRKWEVAPESAIGCLRRPLTKEEIEEGKKSMFCDSASTKTIAPPQTRPKAVLIVGVGGAGKSTICRKLSKYFEGFDVSEYCIFDGDLLRDVHKDYQEIINDAPKGYLNAWPALKPHISVAKWGILNRDILPERRNVIIATGVHGLRYYKLLVEHGYQIDVVGIYVDWIEALFRGINRSHWTGRSYLGNEEMWQISKRDMFDLAKRKATHRSLIIDNTDFLNPKELFLKKKQKK